MHEEWVKCAHCSIRSSHGSGIPHSQGQGHWRKGESGYRKGSWAWISVSRISTQADGGIFLHKLGISPCPLKLVGLGRADAYSSWESTFKQKTVRLHLLWGNAAVDVKSLAGSTKTCFSSLSLSGEFTEDAKGFCSRRRCLHHLLKTEPLSPVRRT